MKESPPLHQAPSRTPGRGANLAGGVIPTPFLLSCPVPSGGGGGGGMEPVPPVAVSLLAEQQEEEEVDKECPQVMPNNCLKVERGEEQAPLPTGGQMLDCPLVFDATICKGNVPKVAAYSSVWGNARVRAWAKKIFSTTSKLPA